MGSSGYVKIHRKIRQDRLWPGIEEKRSFTKFEAWIDLLLTAAGLPYKTLYRDQVINLKRGELIISIRFLSKRWGWSKDRVHRFIQILIETDKIRVHRRDHRLTIIYILKYNTYNPLPPGYESTDKDTGKDTDKDTDKDNIKKDNKEDNKENNIKNDIKNKKTLAPTRKKSASEPKILFDFEKEQFSNIKEKDIEGWKKAYPACEIEMELEQMKQWLLSNPDKKKKLYRRFITNWLSRSQDRGGSIQVSGRIRPLTRKEEREKGMDDWAEGKGKWAKKGIEK